MTVEEQLEMEGIGWDGDLGRHARQPVCRLGQQC